MSLYDTLEIPESKRDEQWEEQLFSQLAQGKFTVTQEAPFVAPDQWPYLMVNSDPEGTESFEELLNWLSTQGVGLILNGDKESPDYVFSYGMLWNYRETGKYFEDRYQKGDMEFTEEIVFEEGVPILAGPPSEAFLPPYVRNILKEFFGGTGIDEVNILVMSQEEGHYDLCFSLDSFGNPPVEEHSPIAEKISWFLPPHYPIILVEEKGLPKFSPL